MPTSVDTLSCVPSIIEAGTTVRFTVGNASFPSSAWTMAFVLNNGVDAPLSIAATTSGTGFAVEIPATAELTPGTYTWAEYYTAISPTTEKARGDTGRMEVLANLSDTATPSKNQAMVTLLEGALSTLAASTNQSVSFSGQSFSRSNISDYREQLVFYKAQVIAEKRRDAALRGERVGGHIGVEFGRVSSTTRFPDCE